MTLGLLRAEQPELSDATAIVASLDAPAAFSRVFERHHTAVHRYLARRGVIKRQVADAIAARLVCALGQREPSAPGEPEDPASQLSQSSHKVLRSYRVLRPG